MSTQPRIVLAVIGSAGDVYPFLGLGRALLAMDRQVTLITNERFADAARRNGLDFFPLGSAAVYDELLKDPDLWHPDKGFEVVMRGGGILGIEPLYEILSGFDPGATVLGFSLLCLGARLAQEKLGFTGASIHLQPACLRSAHDTPVYKLGADKLGKLPGALKRAIFWLVDKCLIDPVLAPPVNAFRNRLGLAPISRIYGEWLQSPDLVIGLFPEFFAPVQPDWPGQTRLAGFLLHDEDGGAVAGNGREAQGSWEEAVLRLGAAVGDRPGGEIKPVVFTPGSANVHGREFFAAAAEAVEILRIPGVFVTAYPEQLPSPLPRGCIHLDYAPFGRLFPLASAVVHHGGIGTTAKCLAAGVPQCLTPFSHDQPDNAHRVARLGAGTYLDPRRITGQALALALGRLLDDPDVAANCRALAARIDAPAAASEAARLMAGLTPKN